MPHFFYSHEKLSERNEQLVSVYLPGHGKNPNVDFFLLQLLSKQDQA